MYRTDHKIYRLFRYLTIAILREYPPGSANKRNIYRRALILIYNFKSAKKHPYGAIPP